MKKLLASFIILLVVILFIPLIVGFYVKQQYLDLIVAINQRHHTNLHVSEYRMGWFTSRMKAIATSSISKNMPPVEFVFDETIFHGPLIYDKVTHRVVIALGMVRSILHIPEPFESLILGADKAKGILQTTSTITFSRDWIIQMVIPAINNNALPIRGKLVWEGLTATSTMKMINSQLDALKSNVKIGALVANVSKPQPVQLRIEPISLSYDGLPHAVGLWTSHFQFNLPGFSFNSPEKNVTLSNLNIQVKNTITENIFYNSVKEFTLEKLTMPGNAIATISPANLTISITKFSAKGMIDFYNFLANSQATSIDDKNQFRNESVSYITKIILPSSALAANAFINTSLGVITATTKAFFAPNTPAFTSPEEIMKNIDLEVNLKIARPLAHTLIESYYYPPNDLPSVDHYLKPNTTGPAHVEAFNERIAALMKEGKLSLPLSLEIMTLSNQSLTPEQFNEGLTKLKLSANIATQIGKIYSQVITVNQTPTPAPTAIAPADKAQMALTEWVQQGYLNEDNNDYVISITYHKSELKINDKIIAWEIPLRNILTPPTLRAS